MKGMFTAMDNSARGMYICTGPVMHTSIPLDVCSYAAMHMTRHRCVQMFRVCPECRCPQVPVDEHWCPQSQSPLCTPVPTCHYLGCKWPTPPKFSRVPGKMRSQSQHEWPFQTLFREPWRRRPKLHKCKSRAPSQPHSGCLSWDSPLFDTPLPSGPVMAAHAQVWLKVAPSTGGAQCVLGTISNTE